MSATNPQHRKARLEEPTLPLKARLRMFDAATARQRRRNAAWKGPVEPADRGWKREDCYRRNPGG